MPINRDATTPATAWMSAALSVPLAVLGLMQLVQLTTLEADTEWWEFVLPALMLVLSVEFLVFGILDLRYHARGGHPVEN